MDNQEVMEAVYRKYPVLKTEAKCRSERDLRNKARQSYKMKILSGKVDLNGSAVVNDDRIK